MKSNLFINSKKSKNSKSLNDINIISPLNVIESRKVYYFQRIKSINDINTFGSQPIIVYKKTKKTNSHNFKCPNQKILNCIKRNETGKKAETKMRKYSSFSHISKRKIQNFQIIKKNQSCSGNNIILLEQAKKQNEERERKKNLEEQKFFSKTVRESNKRPIFPKNKNKQFNLTKTGFNHKNKITHDFQNQEEKEDNSTNKDKEQIKFVIMNRLIENAITMELKKYQNNEINKKNSFIQLKNMKKREYLEENGITASTELITENDNEKSNNKIQLNNETSKRKNTPKINNFIMEGEVTSPNEKSMKTRNKPYIEQFEFIQKIREEQKKLLINPKNINYNLLLGKEGRNFMKQNQIKNQEESKEQTTEEPSFYSIDDKKNHRSTQEINEYLREKRIKYRQNEETKQLEKNKKLFLRFKNLYNLNMKDFKENPKMSKTSSILPKMKLTNRQEERKDDTMNRNQYYYDYNKDVPNNNKKKEVNEFYIGNDSYIKNNNSTVIDANEYFLNVLESQQLLVNSKLKKIDNVTITNENAINVEDNNENEINEELKEVEDNNIKNNFNSNELTVSKAQIKKIIDKEKLKTSGTKKSDEVLNTSTIEELKQKISTTLKRANLYFAKNGELKNIFTESESKNSNITNNLRTKSGERREESKKSEENKIKISDMKIETSDINNQKIKKTENNSKSKSESENVNSDSNHEKELPSLSPSQTSLSNQKTKKENIPIDLNALINLVEVLKFIIQRKVFVALYESYINKAIYQQYNIAFSYFVAICKQYPFKKLEEYYNYKTYNYAFRQLLRPFNRQNFKYFINCFEMRKKVEYLELFLTKMFKFKIMEKIYIFGQYFQEDEEEKAFKMIIMKIMSTLIRPHIYEAFHKFKNNILCPNEKEESEVNFNISDDEENINLNLNSNNLINFNNESNKVKENNNENNVKKNDSNVESNKEHIDTNENNQSDIYSNSMESKRQNDTSLKMNSYLYESLDSNDKSSIDLQPNSLNNDKLHQLKMLLIEKNKNFENCIDDNYMDNDNDIYDNLDIGSELNIKSAQKEKNNKILYDMMDDNSYPNQKGIDILKNTLSLRNNNDIKENEKNNSNSNSSIKSIGYKKKDKITKNEKIGNDTKDTKEITDDSNTINLNLNTNNKSENTKSNIKVNETNSEVKNNVHLQNIKINNLIKNINDDCIEEEKNVEKNSEAEYNISRNNLKSAKILKNYKIIENEGDENFDPNNKDEKSNDEIAFSKIGNKNVKVPLINIINNSNDNSSEYKNSKDDIKLNKSINNNKLNKIFENKEQLSDDLVNEIVNIILFSEIKSPKSKLLPSKKYKFEKFLKTSQKNNNNSSQSQNNSLANSCNSAGNVRDSHLSGSPNSISLYEDVFSLNDSLNSNYSVYSVFNKTIKEKKKEHSLNLYFNNICPKLISYLNGEIVKKYPKIYENISCQKMNCSENLMISLVLQDAQMLRNNYKTISYRENIEKILDKKEILKKFSAINRKIRQTDNITSDNYYDNMLNECILETAIELIEEERFYGENGEPLKWSSRTREIVFKYGKKDAKKFANYICKNILKIIHNRIGLINENYNYLNQDEINYEREKRLLDTIKNDLNRNEVQWKNLEMEETQLKVESTEMILDQLYNEVIEILEHIQYNRICPELYQYKSIYGCEEIPKLSFQQTTTEDVGIPEGEENDFMNI